MHHADEVIDNVLDDSGGELVGGDGADPDDGARAVAGGEGGEVALGERAAVLKKVGVDSGLARVRSERGSRGSRRAPRAGGPCRCGGNRPGRPRATLSLRMGRVAAFECTKILEDLRAAALAGERGSKGFAPADGFENGFEAAGGFVVGGAQVGERDVAADRGLEDGLRPLIREAGSAEGTAPFPAAVERKGAGCGVLPVPAVAGPRKVFGRLGWSLSSRIVASVSVIGLFK